MNDFDVVEWATTHTCNPEDDDCAAALADLAAGTEYDGHTCDPAKHDCALNIYYAHPSNRMLDWR